jgi:hypothetical protein
MKKKKPSRQRILQISNDVAEDMCTASRAELIEVVRFYMNELCDENNRRVNERTEAGLKLLEMANDQLSLAKHSESKARAKKS